MAEALCFEQEHRGQMDYQVQLVKGSAPVRKLLQELHVTAPLVQFCATDQSAVSDSALDNFLSKHHNIGIING